MHQTRQATSTKFPIQRKGTKYVARAASHNSSAVSVLVAARDMLKLAHTAREVKGMIYQRLLKLNGRPVKDMHESIKLFGLFEADKPYQLTLLPTGKFTFEEVKSSEMRAAKVIGKNMQNKRKTQLHLHDGTTLITKEKIAVSDTVYLDMQNKVKKHVKLEKGKSAFVMSGRYQGHEGTIEHVDGKHVRVKVNKGSTVLEASRVVAL